VGFSAVGFSEGGFSEGGGFAVAGSVGVFGPGVSSAVASATRGAVMREIGAPANPAAMKLRMTRRQLAARLPHGGTERDEVVRLGDGDFACMESDCIL